MHNTAGTANTEQSGTEMRLNSGLLFWGVALLTAGAVALAVQAELLPRETVADAWRLWPLILVAIGVGLLLSRSPLAPLGAVVGGIVLGIIGGGLLTVGPSIGGCSGEPSESHSASGALDADSASVEIDFSCGDLELNTQSGSGWELAARGDEPRIEEAADRIELDTPDGVPFGAGRGRHDWTLTLPTDPMLDIGVSINAGAADLALDGLRAGELSLDLTAGDATVDLTEAEVAELDGRINAGSATILVGEASRVAGTLEANAGSVNVCAEEGTDVAITLEDSLTFSHNLEGSGLTRSGDTWRTEGATTPAVTLRIEGNAASFTLDPEEGC